MNRATVEIARRPQPGDGQDHDAARADATQHIQEHSLGEQARIGRLSRIREFVLGAQDGLLVPLGVVTGMAAAQLARSLIIVAGLAEAVAGAISMGGGSYLASQAEEQLYATEIASEGKEIDEFPERETAELAIVLEREGLPRQQAETVQRRPRSEPPAYALRRPSNDRRLDQRRRRLRNRTPRHHPRRLEASARAGVRRARSALAH
jgi:hypothetical protein